MLAYKTFVEDGETLAEGCPDRAAREISSWGTDLPRRELHRGPQRMVEIAARCPPGPGLSPPFPTRGSPSSWTAQYAYDRDMNHFAVYGVKLAEAGARLVGGCCGTTPAHVSALSEALSDSEVGGGCAEAGRAEGEERREVSTEPVSGFAEKLQRGFAVTVEVDLPRGNDISRVVEAARRLQGARRPRHRHLRRGAGQAQDAPRGGGQDRAGRGRHRGRLPHLLPGQEHYRVAGRPARGCGARCKEHPRRDGRPGPDRGLPRSHLGLRHRLGRPRPRPLAG